MLTTALTSARVRAYDPRLWLVLTLVVLALVGTRCGDAYRP